jgi:hypothetical protein
MFPISSYTVPAGGAAGAVFITNIPQNFTHLQFRLMTRSANTGQNAGTYTIGNTFHQMYGDGATVTNYAVTGVSNGIFNTVGNSATANVYCPAIIDILDYSSTTKTKVIKITDGYDSNGAGIVELFSILVNSTAAISGIFFDVGGSGYAQFSRFDLYGISTSNATGA